MASRIVEAMNSTFSHGRSRAGAAPRRAAYGTLAILLVTLLAAGCAREDRAAAPPPAANDAPPASVAPPAEATLPRMMVDSLRAGRVLIALGNEPFWNVRVRSSEIRFTSPDHLDGFRFLPVAPVAEGDATIYRTQREPGGAAEPRALELRVRPGECSDGMSDRRYPMTAELRLDDVDYRGCADFAAEQPAPR